MKEAPSIGSIIKNDKNEDIKRLATKPNAAIDSIDGDPFDKNAYLKATNKSGGTIGDLWDRSREFSERRKEKDGIDFIEEKFDKERTEKFGLPSVKKKKEKCNEKLKKLGVSVKINEKKR